MTAAAAQDDAEIKMLEWGDRNGFRSLLRESVQDVGDFVPDDAPIANGVELAAARTGAEIGASNPFFRSLLNANGELQVGDQLLHVGATHVTVYDADGAVVEYAPIDVRGSGADAATADANASARMVQNEQVQMFGPVRAVQETRTLLKFQFTGRVYTEYYAFYLVSGAFSRHERLMKSWYRGYYYGADDSDTISVSCNTVKRGANGTYNEPHSDSEIDAEGADVTFNYIVGPTSDTPLGSTVSASCTHVVTKDGYTKTLYTAI